MADGETTISATCRSCGAGMDPHSFAPCPSCGGRTKDVSAKVTSTVELLTEMEAQQQRPAYPGDVRNLTSRTKRSRHGKLAREILDFDRSDPHKTIKIHQVEELQPDGTWKIVHDEKQEFKAKRRPK